MILIRYLPQQIKFASQFICLRRINSCQNNIFPISNHLRFFCAEKSSRQEKIYNGILTSQIKAVKVFSVTTSLSGLLAQPILIEQGMKTFVNVPMVVFVCTFVGFFTFVTPFLLHMITKRYVTEINYNPQNDEYTATTLSFFLQKKQTQFKAKDVTVPELPGMFTSFLIGKQGLFVDPTLFPDPNYYIKIMGYDKPIDFKLEINEKENKSDKTK